MSAAAVSSAHSSASRRPRTPALPADAATWLGAYFDWTFGAVWVAMERWRVDATTVVAWAEQARAGGARAGLSTKERTWICAQLTAGETDPEQRPTAVERAMARAVFLGKEQQPAPVAINGIDDAIALVAARLTDEGGLDRTTRDARELRQMLLDDLRILRDEQRQVAAQPQYERSEPTMSVHGDAPVLASTASTMTRMGRPPSSEPKERPATCALCGKAFTAKRYGRDWTTYCSKSCGQQATMRRRQQDAQATTPEHEQVREQVVQVVVDEPPTPAQQSTDAAVDEAAAEDERFWYGGRWTTLAEMDGDEAADEMASATTEPTPPVQPGEPDAAEADSEREQPGNTAHTANGWDGLVALWSMLTRPPTQPLFAPQMSPQMSPWLGQMSGMAALPASSARTPATPTTRTPEPSDDADSLLAAYLDRLPSSRAWTTRERARWLRAFIAALDLEIETTDEQQQSQQTEGQA